MRDIPEISFAIVAPDSRDAMLQHVDEFAARGVPFIFDPGQAMPLFDGDEFRSMIEKATYVIVNDYESQLLQQRTGWSAQEIASQREGLYRHAGPARFADPYRRHHPSRFRRHASARWSTRPVVATLIAPA